MPREFIADGHALVVSLGPDWTIKPEIVCPVDGCKATWNAGEAPPGEPACWLAYMVKEFGSEFLEWWTVGAVGDASNTEIVKLDGRLEIEWYAETGEEPELWWQPVVAT